MNKLILSIIVTVLLATGLVVYENALLRCRMEPGACNEQMKACEGNNEHCADMKSEECGRHMKMCKEMEVEMEGNMEEGHKKCCKEGGMEAEMEENHMEGAENAAEMPACCRMKTENHECKEMMMGGKCSEKDMKACKEMMMGGKCSEKSMKECKEMKTGGKCGTSMPDAPACKGMKH